MRRQTFFKAMLAVSIIFASFSAKAQLDTAWIENNYMSQYIYPPLVDPYYEQWNFGLCGHAYSLSIDDLFAIDEQEEVNCIKEVAQKYEVADSVKIMGAALYIAYTRAFDNSDCDTTTVEIWDSDLINMLYSKTFLVGSIRNRENYTSFAPFVEVLFDDTITLYQDYYVSIKSNIPCDNNLLLEYNTTKYSSLLMTNQVPTANYCTPYACRTKYKPYVKLCKVNSETGRDIISPWTYIDDVTWYGQNTYDWVCSYSCFDNTAHCDTIVHAPIGICPIKVLEDTVSQDTVSQDTTSSGVLSVELLEKAVRVYPNPANEVLNVACDYDIESIAVFDAVNRLVEERKVNSKTLQLPLANYPQGTYFITITTPKGKLNKKFVVQ